MKKILVFGAGKSATVLIDYLRELVTAREWELTIADANKEQILEKTGHAPNVVAVAIDINHPNERAQLVQHADLVISMMPPAFHFLIAQDCLNFSKTLLTASYLDGFIRSLSPSVEEKGILFLAEMGLDPGIDHMSAMKLLDEIRAEGGTITSFKSHCGGLVAPESDDNPWHYKISWNPRNVVLAGKAGATYLANKQVITQPYQQLFQNCDEVNFDGIGRLAVYPNRDSLAYLPIYKLAEVPTFIRTTLRHPDFCKAWDAIVQADLASETNIPSTDELTFERWSAPIVPFITAKNREQLTYLGLFENQPVPKSATTSADIVQHLLETRLPMQPTDKDMILMLHEIEYEKRGLRFGVKSSLVVKGKDHLRTAMAATVGLPLAIAARLILDRSIQLKGIHLPIIPEIYLPVLAELEAAGIRFTEQHWQEPMV